MPDYTLYYLKKLFIVCFLLVLLYSCEKHNDAPSPPGLSSQFVGNWQVNETVYYYSYSDYVKRLRAIDTFFAPTAKLTDSTFVTIQSLRVPIPHWVDYKMTYPADSLPYLPIAKTMELTSSIGASNYGTYSENKDTLKVSYSYGSDAIYLVYQTWIRKK